jgi:hypothetical protein
MDQTVWRTLVMHPLFFELMKQTEPNVRRREEERARHIEEAQAMRSHRTPSPLVRFTTKLAIALRRPVHFWTGSGAAKRLETAPARNL